MDFLLILLCTLCAYLIGAIPSSIWLGKLFFGIDIREHGSGSASHLNVERIMGLKFSLLVRILDVIKGFMAANLAYFVHNKYGIFSDIELPVLMMTFGLAAVMGHIFPIFAGYRGGKGIHVTLGVLIATQALASAIFVGIALFFYILLRYTYLAYLLGALAVPVFFIATRSNHGEMLLPMMLFASFLFVMLFLTHRKEILPMLQKRLQPLYRNLQRPRFKL
jgi:glycerol-3-phosphate acyltransferase PlsY